MRLPHNMVINIRRVCMCSVISLLMRLCQMGKTETLFFGLISSQSDIINVWHIISQASTNTVVTNLTLQYVVFYLQTKCNGIWWFFSKPLEMFNGYRNKNIFIQSGWRRLSQTNRWAQISFIILPQMICIEICH